MKKRLLAVGVLVSCAAAGGADLLACGDKFLVVSRGTRFQRAATARQPANILVYANQASTLSTTLEKAKFDATLRKAGYRPTSVAGPNELEQALRQGGWDLVVADLADSTIVRGQLQGDRAPMVLPIVLNATGSEMAQAKKDYQRVLKGPIKSQALLEAIDDALALREKLRSKTTA
jgi:DNA-binding NtrC family response regulator